MYQFRDGRCLGRGTHSISAGCLDRLPVDKIASNHLTDNKHGKAAKSNARVHWQAVIDEGYSNARLHWPALER